MNELTQKEIMEHYQSYAMILASSVARSCGKDPCYVVPGYEEWQNNLHKKYYGEDK